MANKKTKYQQLKEIKDEILKLEESPLYDYRNKNSYYPVIGEGSHDADIMFIGEAPGKNEAETARPFCGAAGRVLDELLESVALKRDKVYITNIVKDRPPDNRDPDPAEIELYAPFLTRQINIIQPKVLASLGRFSMEFLMKHFGLHEKLDRISNIHGHVFDLVTEYGQCKLVPLYHPAVGLYQASKKPIMKKDFEVLSTVVSLV